MDGTFIVPSPAGSRWTEIESAPIALARVSQGRLFEKHILNKGVLIHPKTGERIRIDDQFVSDMMRNFENNVCDIVQVPLANDKNEHVEGPAANLGEVVGLKERGGKVYAVIDAREDPDKFGKTYLGASAFLSTNYTDSRTGKKAGPTLLHVAVTNRPYVVGLEPYKEIVAATASDSDSDDITVLTPEPEETVPELDELKALLLSEHGIDLDALQLAASQQPPAAPQGIDGGALATAIAQALAANPTLGLSAGNEQITGDDIVGAVVELSQQNATLARGYNEMRQERAEEKVDQLVHDGYILPTQRDFAVRLSLSSPSDFAEFVPAEPIVPVGEQTGFSARRGDDGELLNEQETAQQEQELTRLTAAYKEYFEPSANGARRR